jgi:hypothetical protein
MNIIANLKVVLLENNFANYICRKASVFLAMQVYTDTSLRVRFVMHVQRISGTWP